jgi:hypothetical protein
LKELSFGSTAKFNPQAATSEVLGSLYAILAQPSGGVNASHLSGAAIRA